jgi:hypothetical protein
VIGDPTGANIQAFPTPEMFLSSISGLIVTPKNQLWVSQYGSNFADGSIGSPVLTIAKALSIIAGFADAGPTNWYVINLFSGTFTEDVVVVPWVGIIGQAGATSIAGTLSFASSWNASGLLGFIMNTDIEGLIATAPAGSGGSTYSMYNVNTTASFGVQVVSSGFFGLNIIGGTDEFNFEAQGVSLNCQGRNIGGSCRLESNGADNLSTNMSGCVIQGGPLEVIDDGHVYRVTFTQGTTSSLYLDLSDASSTLTMDASSIPENQTLVAGVITLLDFAPNLGYVAGTPADWSGTPPPNVQSAIDRIAAVCPTKP